ncbi:hypothetical protein K431DRAFT_307252 [Polychaeton citri CBS 116435]|uniref:Uncharacterized protein n=1 Tax=Polychaeton citri CBS 116435 TaxID=1314669 RepID=A0A9P4Q2S3_9PEZI|nr:hypothetical protein K431DRAFT_307252 [Polychaeton citri CBS 116435]
MSRATPIRRTVRLALSRQPARVKHLARRSNATDSSNTNAAAAAAAAAPRYAPTEPPSTSPLNPAASLPGADPLTPIPPSGHDSSQAHSAALDAAIAHRLAAGTRFDAPRSQKQQPQRIPRLQGGYGPAVYLGTLFLGLAATVPLTYWYYGYRKEQMDRKRYQLLMEAQERYKARGGN